MDILISEEKLKEILSNVYESGFRGSINLKEDFVEGLSEDIVKNYEYKQDDPSIVEDYSITNSWFTNSMVYG
jgi:hypothetical protein